MRSRRSVVVAMWLALAVVAGGADNAATQPMGQFRWQLVPYCNVMTLGITQQNGIYTIAGFDDQCGNGPRAGVTGTAFQNPDGTIGIGLHTVIAPGGAPLQIDARISLASFGGPWSDSVGRSGSFVFAPGGSIGGPPRPIAQRVTRVFQAPQVTWAFVTIGSFKYREAVLAVPEITQAIVDSGFVQVQFGPATLTEPWMAVPHVDAIGADTYTLDYSIAVGKVVVRLHVSRNDDPGVPPIPLKVSVLP
jgi:hypothetical protein